MSLVRTQHVHERDLSGENGSIYVTYIYSLKSELLLTKSELMDIKLYKIN